MVWQTEVSGWRAYVDGRCCAVVSFDGAQGNNLRSLIESQKFSTTDTPRSVSMLRVVLSRKMNLCYALMPFKRQSLQKKGFALSIVRRALSNKVISVREETPVQLTYIDDFYYLIGVER